MNTHHKRYLIIWPSRIKLLPCIFAILAAYIQPSVALEASVSGYARLVSGILDDSHVRYHGYDDQLTFDQDSLIGLQTQLKISEHLSATALGVAHSNSDLDSGIEWLYFNYRPSSNIQIKMGQMRTPFYSKSDVLNVGYAYPWVIAPKELYNGYIFDEFQGIDVRYNYSTQKYSAFVEAYYGEFDGDISSNDTQISAQVDQLQGLIGELKSGPFNFRISYHEGDASLELQLEELASNIQLAGFEKTANSLEPDGPVEFYQLGFEYDSLNYFLFSEWTKIKPKQIIFPEITSYYLTLGKYINDLTFLITYGYRGDDLEDKINEIPSGISSDLDQLSLVYQMVFDGRQESDISSWTLGVRWDVRYDTALKAEFKNIQAKQDNTSTFSVDEGESFDNESNILLFGLEWVF